MGRYLKQRLPSWLPEIRGNKLERHKFRRRTAAAWVLLRCRRALTKIRRKRPRRSSSALGGA
jgi:hypothetical protein